MIGLSIESRNGEREGSKRFGVEWVGGSLPGFDLLITTDPLRGRLPVLLGGDVHCPPAMNNVVTSQVAICEFDTKQSDALSARLSQLKLCSRFQYIDGISRP